MILCLYLLKRKYVLILILKHTMTSFGINRLKKKQVGSIIYFLLDLFMQYIYLKEN